MLAGVTSSGARSFHSPGSPEPADGDGGLPAMGEEDPQPVNATAAQAAMAAMIVYRCRTRIDAMPHHDPVPHFKEDDPQ